MLEPWATFADSSAGRLRPMEPCPYPHLLSARPGPYYPFKGVPAAGQQDAGIYLAGGRPLPCSADALALEVAQIARTIARALGLNEDLTEAIALGHDLGHTPFGHAGEAALDEACPFGFRHNEQSLRVVDVLENLNLTREVRNGIVCHTGRRKGEHAGRPHYPLCRPHCLHQP